MAGTDPHPKSVTGRVLTVFETVDTRHRRRGLIV